MAEYKAAYKCRLCGKTYTTTGTTEEKTARRCLIHLIVGVVDPDPLAPGMTDMHHCGGEHAGSLGLADFQGWEKEE